MPLIIGAVFVSNFKARGTKLPDDINILQQLAAQGYLIGTPPQDYDDSYCIRYAKTHNGYLVTNDLYRYNTMLEKILLFCFQTMFTEITLIK